LKKNDEGEKSKKMMIPMIKTYEKPGILAFVSFRESGE
jgi:hypothetical protein